MRVEQIPAIIRALPLMIIAGLSALASLANPASGPTGAGSPRVQGTGFRPAQADAGPPQDPSQGGSPAGKVDSQLKDLVRVELEGSPTEDEQRLAQEVMKEMERRQPQNPGRRKTFGTMAFRGLTPRNRETHLLKQTGWQLVIRGVVREPDGWRAWIHVFALLNKLDGNIASAANKHIEIYRLRRGRLTLEEEFIDPLPFTQDPNYEPSQGLLEIPSLGRNPKPAQAPPFLVQTRLEGTPTEQEKALAREVAKVLDEKRPENPGREKTFARMEFHGISPDGKRRQVWKMKRLSWILTIRRVERIPGGWRSEIHVRIRAVSPEGVEPQIFNKHIEIYTFIDGKLTLESESIDPEVDPSRGLRGALM